MKKIFALILIVAMLVANSYAAVVEVNIGGIQVNSIRDNENKKILLEEVPFVNESGRTMVPVRAITEAFGAEVSWDGDKKEVKIVSGSEDAENGKKTVLLTIDSNKALVNESEVTLDSAPVIKGGRTFVPLRFIGESFGYNINYAASTKQVIIDDTPLVFKRNNAKFSFAEFEALYNIYYQLSYDEASAYGLTEEEIKAAAMVSALETAMSVVMLYGEFPGYSFDEEEIAELKEAIKEMGQYISMPLSGLLALMYEKTYYATGNTILQAVSKSDEVKALYEKNYVCAKHILVNDEESAKTVLAKLSEGADFDTLVKEYGKDPGMEHNKDGYVFTYNVMVKPFEEAAFALAEGEISGIVKSDFGYHIIKREALTEASEDIRLSYATKIVNEKLAGLKQPELLISAEELMSKLG